MANDKAKQPARWRFDHMAGTDAETRWAAAAADPSSGERADLDLEAVAGDLTDKAAGRIYI